MELVGFLSILRRRWWLLVLGAVLAGVVGSMYADRQTSLYEANTTLLMRNQGTGITGASQLNDLLTNERLMNTYVQFASRRTVLVEVIRRLNLPFTEAQLRSKISVSLVRNSQIIEISATDPDPDLAAEIANAAAEVFIADATQTLGQQNVLLVADLALPPDNPTSPNTTLIVLMVVVVSLLLTSGVILVLEYMDDTIKTLEDVEVASGLPTLAVIDRLHGLRSQKRRRMQSADQLSVEDYRDLRTSLHVVRQTGALKTIIVASPHRGEGRSRLVANLGFTLAEAGDSVLIVDADLRHPCQHELLGTPNTAGLSSVLTSKVGVTQWPIHALSANLGVLTGGPGPVHASAIASSRMQMVVAEAASAVDFVIFDSPAFSAVTDASALAQFVDATVLVVEAGRTRASALRAMAATLQQRGATVVGVVITKGRSPRREHRSYGKLQPEAMGAVVVPQPEAPESVVPPVQERGRRQGFTAQDRRNSR